MDGTHNPRLIRVQEQGGEIPGLSFRFPGGAGGGFGHDLIGTMEWRASLSYVSGAHNMKFGYQGGFNTPLNEYTYFGEIIQIRMNNGVINRLTQTAAYPGTFKFQRNQIPANFYAQDQWTRGRATLQGGVRYDHVVNFYPDAKIGGPGYNLMPTELVYPSRSTPGISWHDVTPRIGVAYDLLGNGKTALKFNLGKYMEANQLGDSADLNLHPLVRITTTTTRSWTDTNKDYKPNCDLVNPGEERRMRRHGEPEFRERAVHQDLGPELHDRLGHRPFNWSLGASIQQEIVPRVSVSLGYYRNWWSNWYVVDNRAATLADYTPFSIVAPLDARLPGGGGQTISGLYDLVPAKVGQVDEFASHAKHLGRASRELAGRGHQRERAVAERAHRSRRHEHRAAAVGQLRGSGGVARAWRRPGWRDEQLRRSDNRQPFVCDKPVVPCRRAVPHAGQGPRGVYDS